MPLKQLYSLPQGLLSCTADNAHQYLSEPSLIHLPGKSGQTLFISGMLHGNEPTGFLAIQALLNKYQDTELPRPVSIFLGNTQAAQQGLRHLPGQPDFNRIWPGTDHTASAETRMAQEIVDIMRERDLFASIDIHNNTGLNPHYACINKLDHRFLQLAALFGRFIVHFTRPHGVQSSAFSRLCPAVTLECGRPGQQYGVQHALNYLDTCLHLQELIDSPVAPQNYDLYHTVAQVTIAEHTQFSFDDPDADLQLDVELERMNFTEIPAGTSLGKVNRPTPLPVIARDEQGVDVSEHFFAIEDNELHITRKTMPSMFTLDERVIRQDCLCYLMQKVQL